MVISLILVTLAGAALYWHRWRPWRFCRRTSVYELKGFGHFDCKGHEALEVLAELSVGKLQVGFEARKEKNRTDCRQEMLDCNFSVARRSPGEPLIAHHSLLENEEIFHA